MGVLLNAFDLKPAEAIKYLRDKGYVLSWNWYDTWADAHSRAFTVAKVARLEILRDIRTMVDRALDEGITFQEFKKELEPRLKKHGWWGVEEIVDEKTGEITEIRKGSPHRLRTIFRTNTQTAYNAGRYRQQLEVAARRPIWQYISVLDPRTTPLCRSLDRTTLRYDDPFWDRFYPPNHWGCRARVRTLSERQAEREGLEVYSSDGRLTTQQVTVGDRTVTVSGYKYGPNETDIYWAGPGWDYNPGKTPFKPDLRKYRPGLVKQYRKHTSSKTTTPVSRPKSKNKGAEFVPDGFEKRFGKNLFPLKFWQKIKAKVPFKMSRGTRSYYRYYPTSQNPGEITIGGKRHKSLESRRFVAAHEYGHAYYRRAVAADTKTAKEFRKVLDTARAEIEAMGEQGRRRFNNYFTHRREIGEQFPDTAADMLDEHYLAVSDTIAALTGNKYGMGHSRAYFRRPGMRENEVFAHTTSTNFAGNPAMDKLMPKTAQAMRVFYRKAMK